MIGVGKEVTWTSQAQGSDKIKTGKVIAIVPAKGCGYAFTKRREAQSRQV